MTKERLTKIQLQDIFSPPSAKIKNTWKSSYAFAAFREGTSQWWLNIMGVFHIKPQRVVSIYTSQGPDLRQSFESALTYGRTRFMNTLPSGRGETYASRNSEDQNHIRSLYARCFYEAFTSQLRIYFAQLPKNRTMRIPLAFRSLRLIVPVQGFPVIQSSDMPIQPIRHPESLCLDIIQDYLLNQISLAELYGRYVVTYTRAKRLMRQDTKNIHNLRRLRRVEAGYALRILAPILAERIGFNKLVNKRGRVRYRALLKTAQRHIHPTEIVFIMNKPWAKKTLGLPIPHPMWQKTFDNRIDSGTL